MLFPEKMISDTIIVIIMQKIWHFGRELFRLPFKVPVNQRRSGRQINQPRTRVRRSSSFREISAMYGFVNQALQEFVIRESSFETWEEIL